MQVETISEKDRLLAEKNSALSRQKQNEDELTSLQSQVKTLESELSTALSIKEKLEKDFAVAVATKDKLASRCQGLVQAVEQHKKRSEQMAEDNKKHMEAVFRYQNKVGLCWK